jgi:hypothetical protein
MSGVNMAKFKKWYYSLISYLALTLFLCVTVTANDNNSISELTKANGVNSNLREANDKTMAIIMQGDDYSNVYSDLSSTSGISQDTKLAKEPTVPGKITSVTRISTNGFLVNTEKGNGERRILIMSEENPCELPKDGIDYTGNFSFGSGDKIGEHTFVIFNSPESQQKRFLVSNLKPGTRYYILLCEANSKGESINYLIPDTSKFTAYKSTLPEAPKLEDAFDIKQGSFKLKWNKVKGAMSYFIDVAKDNAFKEFLPEHKDLDVGNISEYLIEDIKGESKVYCRIRAVGESGESESSNIIEVNF